MWATTWPRRSTSAWAARSAPTPASSTGSSTPGRSTTCPTPCCGWSAATSPSGGRTSPSTTGPGGSPTTSCGRTLAEEGTGTPVVLTTKPGAGCRMKAYRIRDEINGISEPPGKTWFWELAGRGHRRRPVHPVRHLRRRLPVQLDRHRRGHRPARAGQDVHRLLAVLGLLSRGAACATRPCGRRRPCHGRRRGDDRRDGAVVRADAADNYWKITGGPPGDGLGAVARRLRGAGRSPPRRRPGRRGGHRPADRRAGRRRHRRRPGHPAERRPRRAVEGRGPPGHHGPGDHRRRRQLLQPDHGPGRARPLPVRPAGQAPDRRGGHAVRDPGHPGHAVATLADRGPPDRRGGADHRPAVHQELRLPGPDAPAARSRTGASTSSGSARSTSSGAG